MIVIQIKFGLSVEFAAHKKELTQLSSFWRPTILLNQGYNYNTTICILGDQNVWHLFIVDISCHPYKVLNYFKLEQHYVTLDKKCLFILFAIIILCIIICLIKLLNKFIVGLIVLCCKSVLLILLSKCVL